MDPINLLCIRRKFILDTTLKYKGTVDILINIGDKSINVISHNSGTNNLFQAICKFLAGEAPGNRDIPKYLDVRESNNNSILNSLIPLSGRSVGSDVNGIYTQCSCSILYQYLLDSISAQEGVNYKLVLCSEPLTSSSNYRDLAEVEVSSLTLSRITAGTSAAVQWKLYIKNEVI